MLAACGPCEPCSVDLKDQLIEEGKGKCDIIQLHLWYSPLPILTPLVNVLVRVSTAVMKHHAQKASWGGKGLFGLHFHITVHHQKRY